MELIDQKRYLLKTEVALLRMARKFDYEIFKCQENRSYDFHITLQSQLNKACTVYD